MLQLTLPEKKHTRMGEAERNPSVSVHDDKLDVAIEKRGHPLKRDKTKTGLRNIHKKFPFQGLTLALACFSSGGLQKKGRSIERPLS